MPYIILAILFALPLVYFLKTQGAFSAFTFKKFVKAFNKSALVYFVLSVVFAFVFAWLENSYTLTPNGTSAIDITAETAVGFIMVSLGAALPLLLILNLVKAILKNKPEKQEDTTNE